MSTKDTYLLPFRGGKLRLGYRDSRLCVDGGHLRETLGQAAHAPTDHGPDGEWIPLDDLPAWLDRLQREAARRSPQATRQVTDLTERCREVDATAAAVAELKRTGGYLSVASFARLAGLSLTEEELERANREMAERMRAKGLPLRYSDEWR